MGEQEQEYEAPGEEQVENPPDEGDGDGGGDEDGDGETEDAAPDDADRMLSEQEREKAYKSVGQAWGRYEQAIERYLPAEKTDWIGCPMCAANMIPGHVHREQLGAFPEEVADNVRYALGLAREQEYEQATNLGVCGDCRGLGKVKTGSKVATHMTVTCPHCKGHGYYPPPSSVSTGGFANGSTAGEAFTPPEPPEQGDRDAWGEPRILPDGTLNENYGRMPQFKTVHPVYGVTANLTAADVLAAGLGEG